MTKTEFKELLHRYTKSTQKEAEQVLLLEKEYPYSQLLRSLAARLSKDHDLATQKEELQMAAVYSADRHVLKQIMSGEISSNTESSTPAVKVSTKSLEYHDYAEEVVHDLEILHELKHNFELLYDEQTKRNDASDKASAKKVSAIARKTRAAAKAVKKVKTKAAKSTNSKTKPKKAKTVKKTKASPKKLAKASRKVSAKKKSKPSLEKKKIVLKSATLNDDLLHEIEISKRRLKPENNKQKEQIQLIDQFIKAQPSISSMRDRAASAPAEDLVSLKQGEFGDQIISETLVDILKRQGKKEKAIEVLKKLIWKFPQKKAYFAAQIEELKQ
ncbi:hypothetical protein SanaruYs_01790 [Chryseotalea sanaruensis]|uniref:Tetratricopeptide repeat protein n=1 Tax=Chryseotalea sanaruensis TaxID=2482724 RepID=A0A401U4R6_9BACT|nr:hypothetical protein [Chryseotalea sanaruensis]GCC49964.1 hypothetical protein SanaruYs_01790 [Chryseotalea sanaruensis]